MRCWRDFEEASSAVYLTLELFKRALTAVEEARISAASQKMQHFGALFSIQDTAIGRLAQFSSCGIVSC